MKENDYVAQPVSSRSYFSKQECERILELSKDISTKDGMTGGRKETVDIRNSKVKWLLPNDDSKWVFNKFEAAIASANQLFNYELTGSMKVCRLPTIQMADITACTWTSASKPVFMQAQCVCPTFRWK